MAHSEQQPSIRILVPQLKQWLRELQRAWEQADATGQKNIAQQWLYDNYYRLEQEGKRALQAVRARLQHGLQEGYPLYQAISVRLCASLVPLKRPQLSALLAGYAQRQGMTYEALEFFPLALRVALVATAAAGCRAAEPQAGGRMLAYSMAQLGELEGIDFEDLLREHSITDRLFCADPAGIYPEMDGPSRRLYCRAVWQQARREGRTEREVARYALERAQQQNTAPQNHVGYYLCLQGEPAQRKRRRLYLLLLFLLPGLGAALFSLVAHGAWLWPLFFFLLWEPMQLVACRVALRGLESAPLPRLNPQRLPYRECSTAVLLSILLSGRFDPSALKQRLVELYHANRQEYLCFCVLADYPEADQPELPGEEALAGQLAAVIEELNGQYGERFCLFLRGRVYSPTQRRYAGWERKRGAILEFARYLKGEKTSAQRVAGCAERLPRIRYLLALDSDTRLLFDRAEELIAAAEHPLNQPVIDRQLGRVVAGYGILAPRMVTSLQSARQTVFSRVTAGLCGVAAYDDRPQDVYQELFGEGIFAGKGLLHLDAFYRLTACLPENQILSHDILEGALLRTAVLSEVRLADSTPASYGGWLARLSRWNRGDWQNLPFVFPRFRVGRQRGRSPIGPLARFWLLDNLRRSLTPVWALLGAVLSVFLPQPAAAALLVGALLCLAGGPVYAALRSLRAPFRRYLSGALSLPLSGLGQGLFAWVFLPQNAVAALCAAFLGLWRTYLSRRQLLQWTTAAQSDRSDWRHTLRLCWPGELLALLLLLVTPHLFWRFPLLLCCLLLPLAWLTARPCRRPATRLGEKETEALAHWAAAMFGWYEQYVREEDHFLPPDNVQLAPVFAVAHRTSPTNIGMYLLSLLAAGDFGLLEEDALCLRLERTLAAVERLETVRGNLYNWYDTRTLAPLSPRFVSSVDSGNLLCALTALRQGVLEHTGERFAALARRIGTLIDRADLQMFYNPSRGLFSVGYDAQRHSLSASYYDFLMSEARATSYFAVARRAVPRKHWARLSRALSRSGRYGGAISWTGTMFEYFMPHLLLPVQEGSLLDESLRYCLWAQRRRVKGTGLPWGVSESAYYTFDDQLNYQYKAHGVQALAAKPGMDRELVLAPYASFLALQAAPHAAVKNLRRMARYGLEGEYGFYEALDCTAGRMEQRPMVIHSYMAHHVGMSLLAAANCVFGGVMQRRFMRDSAMHAAAELLEETAAREDLFYTPAELTTREREDALPKSGAAQIDTVSPLCPEGFMATNGLLTSVYTDGGIGFLQTAGEGVTRRGLDFLRRPYGVFWLCHGEAGTYSATRAPFYEDETHCRFTANAHAGRYETDAPGLRMETTCTLLQNCPCERRELVVRNTLPHRQTVEVLAYFEPALSGFSEFSAHPAFVQLMLVLEYDPAERCLLIHRRGKDGEPLLWLAAGLDDPQSFVFEPKRERLLDDLFPRGLRNFHQREFSCQPYCVDPVGALRLRDELPPGGHARHTLLLACARTRSAAVEALRQGRSSRQPCCPVFSALPEERIARQLLPALAFGSQGSGYCPAYAAENTLGQNGLWGMGVSGDFPIVLLDFVKTPAPPLFALYLLAQSKLRTAMLPFDLVVLLHSQSHPQLHRQLSDLIGQQGLSRLVGSPGGIFLVDAAAHTAQQCNLLRAAACHICQGEVAPEPIRDPFRPLVPCRALPAPLPAQPELQVVGGVFAGARFFVDTPGVPPFCHVLANSVFGTLVSHRFPGCTWAVNARENKLTPWNNDMAVDNDGEQLLLRIGNYLYSLTDGARASFSAQDACYEGVCGPLETQVRISVASKGFTKFLEVTLHNPTPQEVRCMCAYYLEPVLQVGRQTARFLQGSFGERTLRFYNPYNTAVPCHMAAACDQPAVFPVFERAAFWQGRWQQGERPPFHDPCGALIVPKILPPRSRTVLRYTLAAGACEAAAVLLAHRTPGEAPQAPNQVTVQTPDKALNLLLNHFLPNQILAARIRGRCGFYQCGGAYGFRDQLQDSGAYLLLNPAVARVQLLRSCAVQFEEGDVLHWWHDLPKKGGGLRGVRTRYSDDLLWLPFTLCDYLEQTEDWAFLSLPVPYLAGEPLREGETERYFAPERSSLRESVYHHCRRAIEHALAFGPHGLARMGGGDWNDGYNLVGAGGKGESVWLSQFLALVLRRFAPVCAHMGEEPLADRYRSTAEALCSAVDRCAWDGGWYLRAFYDDGTAMGGSDAEECRIDSLPQSFAVLSGMQDHLRASLAVENALHSLVDMPEQIARLFTPPFEKGEQRPGYVKGYPKGIRENGGQYTHAALWLAQALFRLERPEEGYRLLRILNPAARCSDPALGQAYLREPYCLAADLYTNPSRYGQGGWSLYTGAAAWFYRVALQELLGLRPQGRWLTLEPRLPDGWREASLQATLRGTRLQIEMHRCGRRELLCDGTPVERIPLDGYPHAVIVNIL